MLYKSINLNGCILIKFIQWTLNNIKLLFDNNQENDMFISLFSNFYENCYIHSIDYTKKIYNKEFLSCFDNDIELDNNFSIKSGSIAQIYKAKFKKYYSKDIAIKIVHPEVEYQMIFPILFIKIYKFFVVNIKFFNKYNVIFNFDSFFDNIRLQINMNNEYENLNYFYNIYENNPYILIPKPIISTNNVLIMEYYDGNNLNDFDISEFERQKIVILLNLFIKDNYMFLDYIHSDLHESNWKIRKYNEFYQIVIYDFGYVIRNNMQEIYKNLSYFVDLNNYNEIGNLLYDNIINIDISKIDFVSLFINYVLKNTVSKTYDNNTIKIIYTFCYNNNYILKDYVLEIFISLLLFKKNMDDYLFCSFNNNNNNIDINSILNLNLYYYNFCIKYHFFDNVKNYLYEYYINNDVIKNKYKYKNDYFELLNNITDIKLDIYNDNVVNIDI